MNKMRYSLDDGAFPITTAHEEDAGYDIKTPKTVWIAGNGSANIDTGVHVEIPKGHYIKVESKSGLMCKHGIVVSGGVIDSGYTGAIVVHIENHGYEGYMFQCGDKIAQLIIHKHEKPELERVERISGGERGNNGFGSTGK